MKIINEHFRCKEITLKSKKRKTMIDFLVLDIILLRNMQRNKLIGLNSVKYFKYGLDELVNVSSK